MHYLLHRFHFHSSWQVISPRVIAAALGPCANRLGRPRLRYLTCPFHPPSSYTTPPYSRPLRLLYRIATIRLLTSLVPHSPRSPLSPIMSSLARLAPGQRLTGARWDYRIVEAISRDNTHQSTIYKAKVLPHADVPKSSPMVRRLVPTLYGL